MPPALRPQLKALEDDQKRRATRSLRDGIDRILVDLASLYRDILLIQLDADVPLVNRELAAAHASGPRHPLRPLARSRRSTRSRRRATRIDGNVSPALALEAMLVSAIRRPSTERGAA